MDFVKTRGLSCPSPWPCRRVSWAPEGLGSQALCLVLVLPGPGPVPKDEMLWVPVLPSLGGAEKHGCFQDGQMQILPVFLGSSLFVRGVLFPGRGLGLRSRELGLDTAPPLKDVPHPLAVWMVTG